MREPPAHGQHAVEELQDPGNGGLVDIAPRLRHTKRDPELIGAPGGDAPEVNAVFPRTPSPLGEIEAHGGCGSPHLSVQVPVAGKEEPRVGPRRRVDVDGA